jgi:hypothetical protein
MYQQNAGGNTVARSFTEARAKHYDDVINLNWNVVSQHLAQVNHYVSFDTFVRDAGRVLGSNEMVTIVNEKLGAAYYPQLQSWLRTVANPGFDGPPENLTWLYQGLGELRSRFVMSSIGYSLSVAAGDMLNPLVAIASGTTKSRYALPGLGQSLAHFPTVRKDALALSPELAHRASRGRMRMLQMTNSIGAGESVMHRVQQSAWIFMETTDLLTATVIWKGAFNQGLGGGKSNEEAARSADEVVRSQLPSHSTAEQPALLRDKRGVGALTAFYGYFSKLYNVNRGILEPVLQQFQDEDVSAGQKALSAAHAAGRALAVMFVANVMGELVSGRGPEKDETVAEWLMRKTLAAPSSYLPLVGSGGELVSNIIASEIFHGKAIPRQFSSRSSPAIAALDRVTRAIVKMASSKKETDDKLWAALEVLGVITKTPLGSSQVVRTGRAVTSGKAVQDMTHDRPFSGAGALLYGARDKQSGNLGTFTQDLVDGRVRWW